VTPRRALGWAGELLVTAGLLLLLFVAWQLWWTDVVADARQQQSVSALEERFAAGEGGRAPASSGSPVPEGAFAVLRVPRFGADYARPVIEGTGRDVLAEGVGHYAGTAGPGEVGNFAVAGHRTTYGRPFHDVDLLVTGDRVVVETATQVSVYEVTGHEIVLPGEVEVIAPVPGAPGEVPDAAVLTMTSCHPRYSATQRFVVHASLVESVPRAAWDPASTTAPGTGG